MKLDKRQNILSGSNFSQKSDLIFSEYISHAEYTEKKLNKHIVLYKSDEFLLYKLIEFEIKENQVIFCHNLVLKDLFNHLKNIKNISNIKLITHQTDQLITEKIYNQKPDCISEWYSTNVEHKSSNLIPIPLGIANNFQNNYINSNLIKTKSDFVKKNLELNMYINFKKSTNYKERENLYHYFDNKAWVNIDEPMLSVEKYLEQLNKCSFVLAPWGNGIDSHRLWEALYLGKIPITKYHHTYSSAKGLPVLFIDNYENLSEQVLNDFLEELDENLNFDSLNIDNWFKDIRKTKVNNEFKYSLKESSFRAIFKKLKLKIKMYFQSKYKVLKFYVRQAKKIPGKLTKVSNL